MARFGYKFELTRLPSYSSGRKNRTRSINLQTKPEGLVTTEDLVSAYPIDIRTASVATFHGVDSVIDGTLPTFKRRDWTIRSLAGLEQDQVNPGDDVERDFLVLRCLKLAEKDPAQVLSVKAVWNELWEASSLATTARFDNIGETLPQQEGDDWPAAAFRMAERFVDVRDDNGMITAPSVCE